MTATAVATLTVAYVTPVWHSLAANGTTCAFRHATGWKCPFCGLTHAVVALLHGGIGRAVAHNLLAVPFLLGLAICLIAVWSSRFRARVRAAKRHLPPHAAPMLVASVLGFGVTRNLLGF